MRRGGGVPVLGDHKLPLRANHYSSGLTSQLPCALVRGGNLIPAYSRTHTWTVTQLLACESVGQQYAVAERLVPMSASIHARLDFLRCVHILHHRSLDCPFIGSVISTSPPSMLPTCRISSVCITVMRSSTAKASNKYVQQTATQIINAIGANESSGLPAYWPQCSIQSSKKAPLLSRILPLSDSSLISI